MPLKTLNTILYGSIPSKEHLPPKGFPLGKITLTFHPKKFVIATINPNPTLAHHFFVIEKNGFWTPGPPCP